MVGVSLVSSMAPLVLQSFARDFMCYARRQTQQRCVIDLLVLIELRDSWPRWYRSDHDDMMDYPVLLPYDT